MNQSSVEFVKPENSLQKKTGLGGLPVSVIEAAQAMADAIQMDFRPYASNQILTMKTQLDSDSFIKANNDNSIDHFLHNLVPFDVSAKIAKNKAISIISDNLLRFIEGLPNLNIDNHHVIRAHINAMDILTKKDISDETSPVIKTLIAELRDACGRYHTKYKNHKGNMEEWAVG